MNNSPTLGNLIDSRIRYTLSDLHTALPCTVLAYHPSTQSVDIQPLIRKEYSNDYIADLPIIQGIPLLFQGTTNSLISFPINVGDIVLAVFCETSIDKWVNSQGEKVSPGKGQLHDLSDAFAIPGLQTFRTHNSPNPDNLEVRFNVGTSNETSVKMKQDGSVDINAPLKVNINSPSSEFSGDVTISGDIQVDGISTLTGDVQADGSIVVVGTVTADDFIEV
jgi:hypothetical protein